MTDADNIPPDGREAEELRAGLELLIAWAEDSAVPVDELQDLLDRVDARDSLAYLTEVTAMRAVWGAAQKLFYELDRADGSWRQDTLVEDGDDVNAAWRELARVLAETE